MSFSNLLVTGGCGFIGSNFIRYLLEKPDFAGRIVNVDKLTYAGNPENLRDLEQRFPGRYVFLREDICDLERMGEIFTDYGIDAVCHFAAEVPRGPLHQAARRLHPHEHRGHLQPSRGGAQPRGRPSSSSTT